MATPQQAPPSESVNSPSETPNLSERDERTDGSVRDQQPPPRPPPWVPPPFGHPRLYPPPMMGHQGVLPPFGGSGPMGPFGMMPPPGIRACYPFAGGMRQPIHPGQHMHLPSAAAAYGGHHGGMRMAAMVDGGEGVNEGRQQRAADGDWGKPCDWKDIEGVEGWQRVKTDKGFTFYYDTTSGKSTWVVPPAIADAVLDMQRREAQSSRELSTASDERHHGQPPPSSGLWTATGVSDDASAGESAGTTGGLSKATGEAATCPAENEPSDIEEKGQRFSSSSSSSSSSEEEDEDSDSSDGSKDGGDNADGGENVERRRVKRVRKDREEIGSTRRESSGVGGVEFSSGKGAGGLIESEKRRLMEQQRLLADFRQLMIDNKVTKMQTFEQALPMMAFDKRFTAVPQSQRKQLFDKCIRSLVAEFSKAHRTTLKSSLATFNELLDELEKDKHIRSSTTLESLAKRYAADPRWCGEALSERQRRVMVLERVEKRIKVKEAENAERRQLFGALVNEEIRRYIASNRRSSSGRGHVEAPVWDSFKRRLRDDPRYLEITSAREREQVFQEAVAAVPMWSHQQSPSSFHHQHLTDGRASQPPHRMTTTGTTTFAAQDAHDHSSTRSGFGYGPPAVGGSTTDGFRINQIIDRHCRAVGGEGTWGAAARRRALLEDAAKNFINLMAERIKNPFELPYEGAVQQLRGDSRFLELTSAVLPEFCATAAPSPPFTSQQAPSTEEAGQLTAEGSAEPAAQKGKVEPAKLLSEGLCKNLYSKFVEDAKVERVRVFKHMLVTRRSDIPPAMPFDEAVEILGLTTDRQFKGLEGEHHALFAPAYDEWQRLVIDEAKAAFVAFLKGSPHILPDCESKGKKFQELLDKLSGDVRYQRLSRVPAERVELIRIRIAEVKALSKSSATAV